MPLLHPIRLKGRAPRITYESSISRTPEQLEAWNRVLEVLADNLEPDVAEEVAALLDDDCSFRIHDPGFQRVREKLELADHKHGDEEKAAAYDYAIYKHSHSALKEVSKIVPDIETRKRIATALGDFRESCPD